MPYRITFIFLLVTIGVYSQSEQLFLFTQNSDPSMVQDQLIPALQSFSKTEQIELVIRQIEGGAPQSITSTPALIFQNARGRSIYTGRYNEFNTIEHFIRVSRISPQRNITLNKADILKKEIGRHQIGLALKITALKGKKVNPERAKQLLAESESLIKVKGFDYSSKTSLQRTDRLFYLDIHPYQGDNGLLFFSYAIFSQFSCVVPIYQQFDQPLTGKPKDLASILDKIGTQVSSFLNDHLINNDLGEAIRPISSNIPVRSLSELGYPKTIADQNAFKPFSFPQTPLPVSWKLAAPLNPKTPLIQFHFQEPLERYAGEIKKVEGVLKLNPDGSIKNGDFTAFTSSLTMGMASFDAKVLKSYVKAKRYPKSTFRFEQIELNEPLSWGVPSTGSVEGAFQMLQKTHPIKMETTLLPTIDKNQQILLIVQTHFELDITKLFGIKGPDGPSKASSTLIFDLNFIMHPANISLNQTSGGL